MQSCTKPSLSHSMMLQLAHNLRRLQLSTSIALTATCTIAPSTSTRTRAGLALMSLTLFSRRFAFNGPSSASCHQQDGIQPLATSSTLTTNEGTSEPINMSSWFILIEQRWTQIDAHVTDDTMTLFMSLPDALAHHAGPLATFIMSQIDEAQLTCRVHIIRCNPEPNMCGWVLLHSLCERLRIAVPPLANEAQQTINLSRFRAQIQKHY